MFCRGRKPVKGIILINCSQREALPHKRSSSRTQRTPRLGRSLLLFLTILHSASVRGCHSRDLRKIRRGTLGQGRVTTLHQKIAIIDDPCSCKENRAMWSTWWCWKSLTKPGRNYRYTYRRCVCILAIVVSTTNF